jgi:hypothetical protein
MRPTRLAILFLLGVLVLNGCSESTSPTTTADDPTDGGQEFEGTIDPTDGSFVLKAIEAPVPDAAPVRLELIGSDLRVDQNGEIVALKVAIRNVDTRPVYPRIEVIAIRLMPGSVIILESDWTNCPPYTRGPIPEGGCFYGFDYSRTIGDDGVLEPGETSEPRTWTFHVPGLEPFSFGAIARVSLVPDRPRIAGLFFWDKNENGRHDADEPPFPGGGVKVRGPDQEERDVPVGAEGRYAVPIEKTGLYTLTAYPPPTMGLVPVRFTTPNPLEVVIPPDPDGKPQSFLHADFGLVNAIGAVCPPVGIVNAPRDSILFDPYNLIEIGLEDRFLHLHVGFSGCGPEHPFQLLMVGGIMESMPPQVRLKLAHDDRDELCDAYWQRRLCYDLEPIRELIRRSGGSPGSVILNFEDWRGEVHRFEMAVPELSTAG